MISVDLSKSTSFVDDSALSSARKKAGASFTSVQDKSGKGSEWLGWRDLVANPNDAILEEISSLATNIRADADVFIVCGIGGSYLGARAVIEALTPFFGNDGPEIIFAGHQMSGKYLSQLIDHLEKPNDEGEPKSVYLNVISKSGTTLETALSFRVLRKWMQQRFDETKHRISCTTSAEGGALNKLIQEFGYKKFIIPDDVGGRFSVLTPVGLLPIAVAGIDIQTLFYGAVSEYEKLEENPNELLDYAALRYALHEHGKAIDVFASFEPELKGMGFWWQQLLGESEGKNGQGLFPAVVGYSTDLHSLGQLVQDGRRNMIETFLVVDEAPKQIVVEEQEGNVDTLNYLAGKDMHEINTKALQGTTKSHFEGDIPIISLHMKKLNAQSIGELIYFYELFTAVYCYCLDVNPFNQPGVEGYKSAMFNLLGKNG